MKPLDFVSSSGNYTLAPHHIFVAVKTVKGLQALAQHNDIKCSNKDGVVKIGNLNINIQSEDLHDWDLDPSNFLPNITLLRSTLPVTLVPKNDMVSPHLLARFLPGLDLFAKTYDQFPDCVSQNVCIPKKYVPTLKCHYPKIAKRINMKTKQICDVLHVIENYDPQLINDIRFTESLTIIEYNVSNTFYIKRGGLTLFKTPLPS